jgi:hypothetical protein
MNIKLISIGLLSTALLFSACKKDDDEEEVAAVFTVSDTYEGDFEANPPATSTVYDGLGDLSSKMKTADPTKGSSSVSAADLSAIYTAGALSLKNVASSQYDMWVTGTLFSGFETASSTGGVVFDLENPQNTANGGAAFEHLLDGSGVELEQLVEKGSYGGACFSYVKNTLFATPSSVTNDQLDQALVLYGSNPSFEQKKLSAKYTAKRFVSVGGETYHAQISAEFLKAQSAVSQGFESEKVDAVNAITKLWEEAIAAQTIYYLSGVASDLAFSPDYTKEDNADYNTVADALHGWAEGVAFLSGFYKVDGTIITDSQIESILAKVNASMSGSYTPLSLVGGDAAATAELNDLNSGITELAQVYGIDVATALAK